MPRPDVVTDEHLEFLDDLRESGETNMFGAGTYIQSHFGVDKRVAKEITLYWMRTFGDEDR